MLELLASVTQKITSITRLTTAPASPLRRDEPMHSHTRRNRLSSLGSVRRRHGLLYRWLASVLRPEESVSVSLFLVCLRLAHGCARFEHCLPTLFSFSRLFVIPLARYGG